MFLRIGTLTLLTVMMLFAAPTAKADTYIFPFSLTFTSPNTITFGGTLTATQDAAGTRITDWDITFTTQPDSLFGAISPELNSTNSNLIVAPGTAVQIITFPGDPDALPSLQIFMANADQGLDLFAPEIDTPTGSYSVHWALAYGHPESTIAIINDDTLQAVSSVFPINSFPVFLEPAGGHELTGDPAPIPEPSSLFLFGTGFITVARLVRRR